MLEKIKVSILFNFILAKIIIFTVYFFTNFFIIPVVKVNTKVKLELIIPAESPIHLN